MTSVSSDRALRQEPAAANGGSGSRRARAELLIEKGIPIPGAGALGLSHALRQMQVGDSVLVPTKTRTNYRQIALVLGMRIVTRAEGHGIRIWRTE